MKGQLKRLQDAFKDITVETSNVKATTNGATSTSTLGGEEKVNVTPDQFKNITNAVATVRNEIILEY